jgi:hypothetical protein
MDRHGGTLEISSVRRAGADSHSNFRDAKHLHFEQKKWTYYVSTFWQINIAKKY